MADALRLRVTESVVVVALPRGGVPVAAHVARALNAPLDVLVVRKLGAPFQPELALGAIAEGGARFLDRRIIAQAGVSDADLVAIERRERRALETRASRLHRGRARIDYEGRTVVIVDDGIATGATVRAACLSARARGASRVIVAVPVAPEHALSDIPEADDLVSVLTPVEFHAVGQFYEDFTPTTEEAVVAILDDFGT